MPRKKETDGQRLIRESIEGVRPQDSQSPWVKAVFRILEWSMTTSGGSNATMGQFDMTLKQLMVDGPPKMADVKKFSRDKFQKTGYVHYLSWVWLAEECESQNLDNEKVHELIANMRIFISYFRTHLLGLKATA